MVRSTSLLISAVWCRPRALEAGRSPVGLRCAALIRSRSPARACTSFAGMFWSLGLLAEHLQVVRVGHDAEDVAERVDHRGGGEARPALRALLVLGGAELLEPIQRGVQVV